MTELDFNLEFTLRPAYGFDLYFNDAGCLVIKQTVDGEEMHIVLSASEVSELCKILPRFHSEMANKAD